MEKYIHTVTATSLSSLIICASRTILQAVKWLPYHQFDEVVQNEDTEAALQHPVRTHKVTKFLSFNATLLMYQIYK